MVCSCYILVTLLSLFYFATKVALCENTCDPSFVSGLGVRGTIESRRNDTGGWVTTFWAERETKGDHSETDALLMSVNHSHTKCKGKATLRIKGVISEFSIETVPTEQRQVPKMYPPLRFHNRTGANVDVINNGTSVEKGTNHIMFNGLAFTNRSLMDDELFEVRIDARDDGPYDTLAIGVMTHNPDTAHIPWTATEFREGSWIFYESHLWRGKSRFKIDFMKDLQYLQVGETVGVKRTSNGDLHLFINGKDQGVAANDIPSTVFGVLELIHEVSKATIVNH